MSLPQSNLPPVVLAGDPSAETDHRRQRRLQHLTDAGIALLLLLTLGIVFVTDRRSPGRDALYARNASSERFLFDPLHVPIAEVRQNPQRQEWIGAYGGTAESEAAVRRGLDWLARHQSADGHWGPDALHARPDGRCKEGDVCPGGGSEHRVALTGLAVLAFQAGGHYDFNDAEYSECVRHGLDWLVAHQRPDGCLLDRDHGTGACNMYEHGIAAFALADACEMAASLEREPDDRYRQATQKAVQFIHYAQHDDGGWRYTEDRDGPSDVSVSGWQVLALKAARRAGISEVSEDCITRMEGFLQALRRQRLGPDVLPAGPQPAQRRPDRDRHARAPVHPRTARLAAGRQRGQVPGRRGRIVVQAWPQAAEEEGDSPRRRATTIRSIMGPWPCSRRAVSRGSAGTTSFAIRWSIASATKTKVAAAAVGTRPANGAPRAAGSTARPWPC